MKIKLTLFAILLTSAILSAQNPTVTRDEKYYVFTWNEKVEVKSIPSQLTMNHLNGDILIRGYHEESIRYVEKMQINAGSRDEARNTWEKFHLKMEKDNNGYIVNKEDRKNWSFGSRDIRVEYVVDVPMMTSLAVNTLGGDIDISEIQGAVELVSAGGDIRIENTRGRIYTKTYGGDTHAYQLEGKLDIRSAGGDIELRIITGDITIETAGGDILMRTINGNLDVSTFGGDIELDGMNGHQTILKTMGGDIQVEECESDITAETKGGDIIMRNITGHSSGKTFGGDIIARNMNGNTQLKNLAGDISIIKVFGSVNAETNDGSINISKHYTSHFNEHGIFGMAKNGNITLDLPENADVRFDLIARGFGSAIKSDFDMKTMISDSKRKRASGSVEKGTYPVELLVENGNIVIRKRGNE
jgi:DUF4097 and DUF4098 domain-containing protein YvlB